MQVQVDPNEDTEFHDELRKRGIIPQKPPSRSPSPEPPTASEEREETLRNASVQDIDRALEEDGLGAAADDEERRLLALRRQRLAAIAQERKRARFGRVYPIGRPDYSREVTEASKEESDPPSESGKKGTGVVCFLYKDSMDTCKLVAGYLDFLAEKYPATKFVSIVGDKCIPNYPDRNLPTLLIYRSGELHRQIVGLRPEVGLDGMKTKCEDIELLLTATGAIEHSRIPGAEGAESIEEGNEDEDADEGFGGNRSRDRSIKNAGSAKTQEELDAELDWDL